MQGVGRVSIWDGGYLGKTAEITPMGVMRTTHQTRLVGATFSGNSASPDPAFWTPSTGGTGTVTNPYGQLVLTTTGAGVGSAVTQSIRNARYVGGTSCLFRAQIRHDTAPTANNVRRWGAFTADNGAFYEFNGATVNVVTRRNVGAGVVDTPVAQAAWNGPSASTYNASDNVVHAYEIYWTNGTVYFTVDEKLMHKMSASTQTWSSDMNLPVRVENVSTAALAIVMYVRVATISRLGTPLTRPIYRHIPPGSNSALYVALKAGPGTLHGITFNSVGANLNTLTLYDDTAITANVIAVVSTFNANLADMEFGSQGLDYYRALGYVLNGGANPGTADLTILYE